MANIYRSTAHLGDIDMFYLDTRTHAPAIVCLHGRWGRAETWVHLMRHYGDRYRVIAPDQRGHGLSSKPVSKYTAEEMAADVIALLDALNIPSAIVAGQSMGGCIAGFLAALYPERISAIAILDKSAAGPENVSTLPLYQLCAEDPLTKDWPLPFPTLYDASSFIKGWAGSELEYEYFMASVYETPEGFNMMFSTQAIAANIEYDQGWFHLLPNIKCPVLLMRAKGGAAVPDADFIKMQSLLPACIARESSSPDHNVQLSDKEGFYACFDELLSKV